MGVKRYDIDAQPNLVRKPLLTLSHHSGGGLLARVPGHHSRIKPCFLLLCISLRTNVISVGVLVLEEEDEKGLDLGGFGIYITVVAWIMVGIGALYFLLVSLLSNAGQSGNLSVL